MRTIAIIGREGSGKTTLAINLALALRHMRKKVTLIDMNIANPDVSLYINAHPHKTLNDVIAGKCSVEHAIYRHASGADIIFSSLKTEDLENNKDADMPDVSALKFNDFVIIDTPGFGKTSKNIIEKSSDVIFVSTPSVQSAFDIARYREILGRKKHVLGVVLNNAAKGRHELSAKEVAAFTGVPIMATVPHDASMIESVNTRKPVMSDPNSRRSKIFIDIASLLCRGGMS